MYICNKAFSVYELGQYSMETEVFNTNTCIPNGVKFFLFLSYLLIYTVIFIYVNYLLYRQGNILTTSWKNIKKIIYVACWFGCLGHLLSFSLFLLGIQNRYKFLVFCLVPISNRFCASVYLYTWFSSLYKIDFTVALTEKRRLRRNFNICCRIVDVLNVLVTLVFITVGPVIVYDNARLLNWFYVLGISVTAFVVTGTCLLHIYAGNNLIRVCKTNVEVINTNALNQTSELTVFINKVNNVTTLARRVIPLQIILLFIPIWMLVTTLSPNHSTITGLNYIFYFHFAVMQPLMIVSLINNIYAITRHADNYGSQLTASPSLSTTKE